MDKKIYWNKSYRPVPVLCELFKDEHKIMAIYSREYEKGNPSFIAERLYDLHQKYRKLCLWIDGNNRAFVNELKVKFGKSLIMKVQKMLIQRVIFSFL